MITKPTLLPPEARPKRGKTWLFPRIFANDLAEIALPESTKQDILSCAWDFARNILPEIRDWGRYIAFVRILVIAFLSEFPGDYLDRLRDADNLFGYKLNELLELLFCHLDEDVRHGVEAELRTFLLKQSVRGGKEMSASQRSLLNHKSAIDSSPENWFRMRDFESLFRFLIAAVLACNGYSEDYCLFSEDQLQLLSEMNTVIYDTVTFRKHADADLASIFDFVPEIKRSTIFREYREVLLAMDAAFAWNSSAHVHIRYLMRNLGGSFRKAIRRSCFVSSSLVVRRHVSNESRPGSGPATASAHSQISILMQEQPITRPISNINGRSHLGRQRQGCDTTLGHTSRTSLQAPRDCPLSDKCANMWLAWLDSIEERAAEAFPQLKNILGLIQDPAEETEQKTNCLPLPTWAIDKKMAHDPWTCICAWSGEEVLASRRVEL
jgi:hypothetical protein